MFTRNHSYHLNGSILISVTILLGLLFILGSTLLRLSLIDSQITWNLKNNLKAYYYAVSGIEMALGVLETNPGYRGAFLHDFEKGFVDVSIEEHVGQSQDEWLKIVSTGKNNNARETVYLKFKTIPSTPDNARCSAALGWIDFNSGEMLKSALTQDNIDVSVHSALLNGVYARECSDGYVYRARSIYFEGNPSIIIENSSLELVAEAIVFRGSIILSGQESSLHVRGISDNGIRVQFVKPVKDQHSTVLAEAGTYVFPSHFFFLNGIINDINDYRVFPIIPETKRWGQHFSH